jgi:hypothetical protein
MNELERLQQGEYQRWLISGVAKCILWVFAVAALIKYIF